MSRPPNDGGLPCPPDMPLADRVLRYLEWRGDCLEWRGASKPAGYGMLNIRGHKYQVTRVVMEMIHGPIPEDMKVCHTCDNPPCCNPDHLYIGTDSDNAMDAVRRGRRAIRVRRGTAHENARHSDEVVDEVRSRYAAGGVTQRDLAAEYGVDKTTVQKWVSRKNRANPSGTAVVPLRPRSVA